MLVSLAYVMRRADRGGYAVGAFNTTNLEITQAILAAAISERSPVIIATSAAALAYAQDTLPVIVQRLAASAPVPVVLHLDHGRDLRRIRWCLREGYTSLMYDGSRLPFAENVRRTAGVVRLAHARRVSVEGELGTIGGREDAPHARGLKLADPAEAKTFVQKTRVDVLAAAFGSAHGGQLPSEHLDFSRLRAIRERIRIPLAFHGASETPPAHFRKAIRFGVRKINIDTDVRMAFTKALRATLRHDPNLRDPRKILFPSRDAVTAAVRRHLRWFGSSGRAP